MKFTKSCLASLLASVAVAWPRTFDKSDPLPETSRITAFSVKDGRLSVECWEISRLVGSSQIRRTDGTSATAQALSLASAGELDGLDIFTWPSYSPIWPPQDDGVVHAESVDLSESFSVFSVQNGMLEFELYNNLYSTTANEKTTHIFDMQNGDDWFYFEDNTSSASSASTKPYPVRMSTISGVDTELLRLRYKTQPKHKVVHNGACSFNGFKSPSGSLSRGAGTARVHSPLTVQVTLEDSL